MLNRHQQIQKTQPQEVRSGSICVAKKLCPRGDLSTCDTSRDPAIEALKAHTQMRGGSATGAIISWTRTQPTRVALCSSGGPRSRGMAVKLVPQGNAACAIGEYSRRLAG